MKQLAQEVSLAHKCEEITISELRSSPGAVLAMVALGKTYIITRNGKQVAVLSKVPGQQLTMVVAADGKKTYRL